MPRRELFGLVTFFLIAFGIPWFGWAVIDDERLSLWLFPLFCSIGGFCAAYVEGGTDGLREFCRRTLQLRGALKWILLASVIPLVLGLSYLLGSGVQLSSMHLSMEAILGLTLAAALVTGPLAEEFGWRGYLQHNLLRRMRPIWVVLVVGAIWCAWHIPLYYSSVFSSPDSTLRFLAYTVTWSVFILYLVERANGSVWPAVFFHWGANTHADVLRVLFPSVDGSQLPGGSKTTVMYVVVALVFAAMYWRFFTTRTAATSNHQGTSNILLKPKPLRGSA